MMFGLITRFVPSKIVLYSALAAFGASALAWIRWDAKRDYAKKLELDDYEHAEDIENRVAHDRSAPDERLRKYDSAGWRD